MAATAATKFAKGTRVRITQGKFKALEGTVTINLVGKPDMPPVTPIEVDLGGGVKAWFNPDDLEEVQAPTASYIIAAGNETVVDRLRRHTVLPGATVQWEHDVMISALQVDLRTEDGTAVARFDLGSHQTDSQLLKAIANAIAAEAAAESKGSPTAATSSSPQDAAAAAARARLQQEQPSVAPAPVATPAGPQGNSDPPELDIDQIVVKPQVRKTFDPQGLEELAGSIREVGIIQPLTINEIDFQYELVCGERRLRAARMAGLTRVPVNIRYLTRKQVREIQLTENLQRRDLDPIEEAEGYRDLLEDHGYTQESLAQRLGLSQPYISNRLRLLRLPENLREAISRGIVPPSTALAVVKWLPDDDGKLSRDLVAAIQGMIENPPSAARAAEWLENRLVKEPKPAPPVQPAAPPAVTPPAAPLQAQLAAPPAPVPPQVPIQSPAPPPTQPPADLTVEQLRVPAKPPAPQETSKPTPPAAPPGADKPTAPPAQPAAPQQPPVPREIPDPVVRPVMDISAVRTLQVVGIGAWPDILQGATVVFDIESCLPITAILQAWQERLVIGAAYCPRGFGNLEIQIPEQQVWIRGRETAMPKPPAMYQPGELALVVDGDSLTVQCVGGHVTAQHTDQAAYYRVALQSTGTHHVLRQQVVIPDGDRHIVATGNDTVNMQQPQVQALIDLLQQLPAG